MYIYLCMETKIERCVYKIVMFHLWLIFQAWPQCIALDVFQIVGQKIVFSFNFS